MKNMKLEVYGFKLEKCKFKEIKNKEHDCRNKPLGGLWTSPVGSDWSWEKWCRCENFQVDSLDIRTEITLKPDARLYKINSETDMILCPSRYDSMLGQRTIDFEALRDFGYSGIWLTKNGVSQTRLPNLEYKHHMNLNAWDVETVLLFNLDCIEEKIS